MLEGTSVMWKLVKTKQMRTHRAIYSDFAVARQSATRIGRNSRQGGSAKLYLGKTTASGMPPVEAVGIGELPTT